MPITQQFLATTRIAKTFFKKNVASVFKGGLYDAIKKSAATGTSGGRLFPKQDSVNDKKYGLRVDLGEKYQDASKKWFRNFNLQINSDPENQALKNEVNKAGSHPKRLTFTVPLNADGTALSSDITKADVDKIIDDLSSKGV